MVKRRGWIDNTLSRFPTAEELRQYSCGKTAGKNKGRRGIVITARWTRRSTARNGSFGVRGVAKVRSPLHEGVRRGSERYSGNAPYHTRVLEKVPTRSSRVQEIWNYLSSHGVEVGLDSTKEALLEEVGARLETALDHFVATRGGAAALRCYAAEKICEEMGVSLLRLPPFHCFFNPVELCWSHLKQRLNKIGRPTDRLEIVKSRTVEILGNVTRQLCEGWCREAIREEDSARLKEALDANNNFVEDEDMSSSSHDSSDDTLSDGLFSEFSIEL
ncbi:hypothetical protein COOONC_11567 [Cooperia oncophora]